MITVSLELFKAHTRTDDIPEDDALMEHYLGAAGEWVERTTHRTEAELREMNGGKIPSGLRQAVMLLAAHWYNQREGAAIGSMAEIPLGVQALVKPWRRLSPYAGRTNEDAAEAPEA